MADNPAVLPLIIITIIIRLRTVADMFYLYFIYVLFLIYYLSFFVWKHMFLFCIFAFVSYTGYFIFI